MCADRERRAVSFVEVGAEQHGQRVDNFLLRELKGVPKSRIYRILRKGEVRVNKGRVKPDHRLQSGDVLRLPPLRRPDPERADAAVPAGLRTALRRAVLYEDDALLVIDKPAGLAVHKGSGVDVGVIEALRAERDGYLELAHRLDRDTSGCLLLAKSAAALREVQTALRERGAHKRYLALVRGQWDHGRREVDAPLRKNAERGGERVVVIAADGKTARSVFTPVSLNRRASLLEVELITGRTHQIRVHADYAGHPLAGDNKYGDEAFNRSLRDLGLRRMFLHAHSLLLPLGGRELALSSPLPDDLKTLLEALRLG